MFVYTAKCSGKKLGLILVALLAVVILVVLVCAGGAGSGGKKCETDAQRIEYLESFGWQISDTLLEEQQVLIPQTLDGVYEEYARLQTMQGFHLDRYCGMEATRYTYTVENYPDASGTVVADLLICNGTVIAGDIQCVSMDGFMIALDPACSDLTLS